MTAAVEAKPRKNVRLPKKVAEGSVAGKIRFLDEKGLTRVEISKQLGIRYQRVRNVLVPRVRVETPEELEEGTETSEQEGPSTNDLEVLSQAS